MTIALKEQAISPKIGITVKAKISQNEVYYNASNDVLLLYAAIKNI